jgi:glyoxylase-like metal-dependent hydrolase (beta-lactamase superfamily II)
VLVDTGLDKDTAKKILRHMESLKVKLAAVVITHAHADHFGGAATVRARLGVPLYAPALEAAIVANPILEPLYLYSGAAPAAELRHKFTLAEACPVDRLLEPGEAVIEGVSLKVIPAPGHAPNQMMIAGGAAFVADAVSRRNRRQTRDSSTWMSTKRLLHWKPFPAGRPICRFRARPRRGRPVSCTVGRGEYGAAGGDPGHGEVGAGNSGRRSAHPQAHG